jgi:hypothetical protein
MNGVATNPKKVKLLGIAVGALLFVILGFYLAQNRVAMGFSLTTIIITSYVGIPFFGLCLGYAVYEDCHGEKLLRNVRRYSPTTSCEDVTVGEHIRMN